MNVATLSGSARKTTTRHHRSRVVLGTVPGVTGIKQSRKNLTCEPGAALPEEKHVGERAEIRKGSNGAWRNRMEFSREINKQGQG